MRSALTLVLAMLLSCAHAPTAQAPAHFAYPVDAEYHRPTGPAFNTSTMLIYSDLLGEHGRNVKVPDISGQEPVVCFDLPSHHAWYCVYIDIDQEVSLQVVLPTWERF